MRRYILVLSAVFILGSAALADEWHVAKSTHFLIYYKNAPETFVNEVMDKAEDYYNRIADDLGFRRFNFWLWDNRAKIYIHDSADDYHLATNQPAWSAGCADYRGKIIHSYPYAQRFSDTILPHEMGHIIFREFVGVYNSAIPTWLDEGVASYEQDLRFSTAAIIKDAWQKNRFIPLTQLSGLSPHSLTDTYTVNLFYAEAVSAVEYLVKEFGQDRFILFCQELRDKKDLNRALGNAYSYENITDLDKAWQSYLNR